MFGLYKHAGNHVHFTHHGAEKVLRNPSAFELSRDRHAGGCMDVGDGD